MKASWKTTLFGLLAATATGIAATPGLPAHWQHVCTVAAGLCSGLGLMFARDFNRSSEDQGIKPSQPLTP